MDQANQDSKPGKIILLSGPIGAGKTTVAQELVAQAPAPAAYIEGDKFWCFLKKPADDDNRNTRFRLIMRSMALAARPLAGAGYEVIVDFTFPPGFLEYARVALKEIPLYYIVLIPNPSVCAARAASRAEGAFPDYSEAMKLYSLFDRNSPHALDNDGIEPAEMAKKIRLKLEEGAFRIK